MSYTNKRTILEDDENGYIVEISPLNEIKEGLKGSKITIKRLKNGNVRSDVLFHGWLKNTKQASQLFERICQMINYNKDNFTLDEWDFPYHPIHFCIKHRN